VLSFFSRLFKPPPEPPPPAEAASSPPKIRWGFVSITGNFRENNEDRCLIESDGRFFLVADGMGGQSAGEKASEMAVELISEKLRQLIDFEHDDERQVCDAIDKSVVHANAEIMALSSVNSDYHNMGTTIAMLVRVGRSFYVAGIGDSRVYQLRGDSLQQLTTDHSITQALLEAGTITKDEAGTHRYRNVLWRYLGSKEASTGAKAFKLAYEPGDKYIVCSDGVCDGANEATIRSVLEQQSDPQSAAAAIVESAQAGGSKDNITCVVVFVS
jgi:protein phosphatase